MKKKRYQFSIRLLLLVPIVVAALCYFALIPSMKAQRFVDAVRSGRPDVARKMLKNQQLNSTHEAAIDGDYDMYVVPLSFSSLWDGQTFVSVQVPEPFAMPGGTWFRFKFNDIEVSPETW